MHELGGGPSRLARLTLPSNPRVRVVLSLSSACTFALCVGALLVISTLMTIVITKQSETENWCSSNQIITAIYSADLYHNPELGEDISKLTSACSDRHDQEQDHSSLNAVGGSRFSKRGA